MPLPEAPPLDTAAEEPSSAPPGGPATSRTARRVRRAGPSVGLAVVGVVLVGWWWGTQPQPDAGALSAPAAQPATEGIVVPLGARLPAFDPSVSAPLRELPYATGAPAAPAPAPAVLAPVVLRGDHLPDDVTVDPEGVVAGGAMALPENGRRVGWYRFGAAPGDAAGSTVLAGHVDTLENGRGALADTGLLEVGDHLQVVRSDGSTVDYAVTARVRVGKTSLPVDELFVRDGAPRLVLITCGGAWDPDVRHYADNVVVTADPT